MDGGNFGAPPNPPRCGVVLPGQPEQRLRQLLLAGGLGRRRTSISRPARSRTIFPATSATSSRRSAQAARTPSSTCRKEGMPLAGRGREVGAEVEGLGVRRQEHGHGPAALPGRGLHGLHVDGVDVGTLLTVDLDADEVLVEVGRR